MRDPEDREAQDDSAVAEQGLANQLQMQLAETLVEAFDGVVSSRRRYDSENPDKIPSSESVPALVAACAKTNMLVSGGTSLIPGPFRMIAAVPEIMLLIRNQLAMIYDIGMAHGKSRVLGRELLAGVFISALATSVGGLMVMHGGKVLVKRVALRVFQRVVALLAGRVTQQVLKSIVAKWLPLIGAAAMAAWARYSTAQIGKRAAEILAKPIQVEEEGAWTVGERDLDPSQDVGKADPSRFLRQEDHGLVALKIRLLIHLIKVDRKVTAEERMHVEALIENSALTHESGFGLRKLIDCEPGSAIDLSLLARDASEAVGLMMDLVGLAKRDGAFHLSERIYIRQVGKALGLLESDIEDLMSDA